MLMTFTLKGEFKVEIKLKNYSRAKMIFQMISGLNIQKHTWTKCGNVQVKFWIDLVFIINPLHRITRFIKQNQLPSINTTCKMNVEWIGSIFSSHLYP